MANRDSDTAMTDIRWSGWNPRGATPLFLLALVLTLSLLGARLIFSELLGALPAYIVVLGLWSVMFCVAAYRAVTYTYRITDRALIIDRGFLNLPILPLTYSEMKAVEHGGSRIYSLLGIGWVAVTMNDGRTIRMSSVFNPHSFAELLRSRLSV